jgi:hypothetical protein
MPARIWLWGLLALIVAFLALGAFGQNNSLEKAVRCDQFKRLPNGQWVAVQDISLVYGWRTIGNFVLGSYQWNFNNGTTVTGNGGSEDARLFAALNKVCVQQ